MKHFWYQLLDHSHVSCYITWCADSSFSSDQKWSASSPLAISPSCTNKQTQELSSPGRHHELCVVCTWCLMLCCSSSGLMWAHLPMICSVLLWLLIWEGWADEVKHGDVSWACNDFGHPGQTTHHNLTSHPASQFQAGKPARPGNLQPSGC